MCKKHTHEISAPVQIYRVQLIHTKNTSAMFGSKVTLLYFTIELNVTRQVVSCFIFTKHFMPRIIDVAFYYMYLLQQCILDKLKIV